MASDTWALLASGAIGAGGAVLAQLTAILGSKKRLEHEDEQQRSARFLEIKRELYSTFLLRAEKLIEAIDTQRANSFDEEAIGELMRIHYNIWMIASPEVTRTIRMVIADLATIQKQCSLPESYPEYRSKRKLAASAAIRSARDALSADLTGYRWPARNRKDIRRGRKGKPTVAANYISPYGPL